MKLRRDPAEPEIPVPPEGDPPPPVKEPPNTPQQEPNAPVREPGPTPPRRL